jgi:hypothetical protein
MKVGMSIGSPTLEANGATVSLASALPKDIEAVSANNPHGFITLLIDLISLSVYSVAFPMRTMRSFGRGSTRMKEISASIHPYPC